MIETSFTLQFTIFLVIGLIVYPVMVPAIRNYEYLKLSIIIVSLFILWLIIDLVFDDSALLSATRNSAGAVLLVTGVGYIWKWSGIDQKKSQ
jgi:hypothetical protein